MTFFIRYFARLLAIILMILGLGIAAIGSRALTAAIKLGQRYWRQQTYLRLLNLTVRMDKISYSRSHGRLFVMPVLILYGTAPSSGSQCRGGSSARCG